MPRRFLGGSTPLHFLPSKPLGRLVTVVEGPAPTGSYGRVGWCDISHPESPRRPHGGFSSTFLVEKESYHFLGGWQESLR